MPEGIPYCFGADDGNLNPSLRGHEQKSVVHCGASTTFFTSQKMRGSASRYSLKQQGYAFGRIPVVLEQMTGIEPAYLAWEASALPLSYICIEKNAPYGAFCGAGGED